MRHLIKIIKRLLKLRDEAGAKYLYYYWRTDSLDLFSHYQQGIVTLCKLIKKKDLKGLSEHELNVLVLATNPNDKLRKLVFERQKTFPQNVSESEHRRQQKVFVDFYSQPLMEI